MQPRLENLKEKKFVGHRMQMSLTDNKTGLLWGRFMPKRKEIINSIGTELYSIQIYPPSYFNRFDPAQCFEKWATMEVSSFHEVSPNMETLTVPTGLYAVFIHHGSNMDTSTFDYIFNTWLPSSNYQIDTRPHFEILGARYKNGDPNSEEEIWIPIIPEKV
jgi:AraC family transcriptional regulator